MNQTPDKPQWYVIDTNTIIDLHCGNLLPVVFDLPCYFLVTDLLRHELRNPPFDVLSEMGLQVESLSSDQVMEISVMMGRYDGPSYEDISVLVLARLRNTVLITGDEALRRAAADNCVDCHGTCWLIDYLADQKLISYAQALAAYTLIHTRKRFPPRDECEALVKKWKQRQKLE